MKKYLFISLLSIVGIIGLLVVLFLFALWPFRGISGKIDYNAAKTECVDIFENNKEDLMSADIKTKHVESFNHIKDGTTDIIIFNIGSQGTLGGQNWGVYFISDDIPIVDTLDSNKLLTDGPYSGSYYYQKQGSNNFYATERIDENWYFFYMDYDGNKHGLDLGIS